MISSSITTEQHPRGRSCDPILQDHGAAFGVDVRATDRADAGGGAAIDGAEVDDQDLVRGVVDERMHRGDHLDPLASERSQRNTEYWR